MGIKKNKKPNRTSIGGQAVFEGVMMRGKTAMATAVRDEDGIIRLESKRITPASKKNIVFRLPIIRGAINFFISMVSGIKTLMRSTEVFGGDEPSKFDKWLSKTFKIDIMDVIVFLGVALGLLLSVLLFIFAPQYATEGLSNLIHISNKSVAFNFIEGGLRIVVFVLYILATSLLKDIKRTYKYHGAEHKTISCYEAGLELNVENVKKCSRVHDRCGTTFMFFVMLVSVFVFSIANIFLQVEGFWRMLVKIALLPLVAGLSYELLKGLAKTDFWLFFPLKLPGLLLQRITTSEPEDEMIEVAITAFNTVLAMDADENIPEVQFVVSEKIGELCNKIKNSFKEKNIDSSDAEWIVSIICGIKRSEIDGNIQYISPKTVDKIMSIANERMTGRPLWYIIGNTEFYGKKIKVDERVLIPRPETEELVYNAIKRINSESLVLDLCTGSGACAIAIKAEKACIVDACDISEDALTLARENATENKLDINFFRSDLFSDVKNKYNLIISNPPYIKSEDIPNLDKEVSYEPKIALDGGEDGLDIYRRICSDAPNFLVPGGTLIMECGIGQANQIADMLSGFQNINIIKDLNGVERIVEAELKE